MIDLSGAVSEFLQYIQVERNFSQHTVSAYRSDLNLFVRFCSERKVMLTDIDINLIRKFLAYLYVTRHIARTVSRYITSLKSCFMFAADQEWIQTNPMLRIRTPKVERRLPVYLSSEELNQLLTSVDNPRDRAVLTLLAMTGIRLDELVCLNLEHIYLNSEAGSVRVLGKGRKERELPLNRVIIKALHDYLNCRPDVPTQALFVSRQKGRLMRVAVQGIVKKYVKRAGIKKITVHSLRHTFATLLHSQGISLREIQELLGHTDISSTAIYTHCNRMGLQTAVGALNNLIDN